MKPDTFRSVFPATPGTSPPGAVLTVSDLNRLARQSLERSFPLLRVSGEISNLTRAASGHIYFTLKDSSAQVRCTMWRSRAQQLGFAPTNGARVEVQALVTLYEARGDFQLTIERMQAQGDGALFARFMQLRERLGREGLFDEARKRPLPALPRRIGVVTSPQAAAWRDVLATLARHAPHLDVVLYPSAVQGDTAAAGLAAAVATAGARAARDGIDVLLLVRGGGSLEDLWAFNDETLARRIAACSVPVVSGVGHETDFTIADFAADQRAATPTMAAELATAGYGAARARLHTVQVRLAGPIARLLAERAQRLDRAAARLIHPRERLRAARQHEQALAQRLLGAIRHHQQRAAQRLAASVHALHRARPDPALARARLDALARRLHHAMHAQQERAQARHARLADALAHLDPTAVLERGYSIVRDDGGHVVRSVHALPAHARFSVQLADGNLAAQVLESAGSLPDDCA